ncbi:MAG: macro domain-containing protein, partial [Lentisphaerales bacterium]|nr:macro domain-containing protein [Lentisphaerales bacterium]
KRWPQPEAEYRAWMTSGDPGKLGETQIVEVEDGLYVANMVAQRHVKKIDGVPPIRYEAVEGCLQEVAEKASELKASVHMPRIGCGLAGGEWDEIEKCITNTLLKNVISVYVYDFV